MEKKTNEEKMMDLEDSLKAIAEAPIPVGTKISFEVKESADNDIYTIGFNIKGNTFSLIRLVLAAMATDKNLHKILLAAMAADDVLTTKAVPCDDDGNKEDDDVKGN